MSTKIAYTLELTEAEAVALQELLLAVDHLDHASEEVAKVNDDRADIIAGIWDALAEAGCQPECPICGRWEF